jgi:dsRNA-specific ribonuclease
VHVNDELIAEGEGFNKKTAGQAAAEKAYAKLEGLPKST